MLLYSILTLMHCPWGRDLDCGLSVNKGALPINNKFRQCDTACIRIERACPHTKIDNLFITIIRRPLFYGRYTAAHVLLPPSRTSDGCTA